MNTQQLKDTLNKMTQEIEDKSAMVNNHFKDFYEGDNEMMAYWSTDGTATALSQMNWYHNQLERYIEGRLSLNTFIPWIHEDEEHKVWFAIIAFWTFAQTIQTTINIAHNACGENVHRAHVRINVAKMYDNVIYPNYNTHFNKKGGEQ